MTSVLNFIKIYQWLKVDWRQKGDLISIFFFPFGNESRLKKQTVHVSFPQSMTKTSQKLINPSKVSKHKHLGTTKQIKIASTKKIAD
jgi:hypothetical protein